MNFGVYNHIGVGHYTKVIKTITIPEEISSATCGYNSTGALNHAISQGNYFQSLLREKNRLTTSVRCQISHSYGRLSYQLVSEQ